MTPVIRSAENDDPTSPQAAAAPGVDEVSWLREVVSPED